ncbi:hypothetical protein F66182_4483 [Fusarium sp. NRRL 66182]|nr:hypothetical protein F66182_4483 [Fusarium sp. NRRL 66182]
MSNFGGRRGPNVSQYLRDLNAINRQESSHEEPFNMEEDLALFTNTQFFDIETGQNTDYQAHPVKVDMEAPQSTSPSDGMTPAPSVVGDIATNFDFSIQATILASYAWSLMGNEQRIYRFISHKLYHPHLLSKNPTPCVHGVLLPLGTKVGPRRKPAQGWPACEGKVAISGWEGDGVYGAISLGKASYLGPEGICKTITYPSTLHLYSGHDTRLFSNSTDHYTMAGDFGFPDFANPYPSTPLNGFADGAQNFPPIQPNAPAGYSVPQQQPHYGQQAAPQPSNEKRGSESGPGAGRGSLNFEEASRHAAEEDKRRRNTAASARFRIKKKQREQALEKSAKEMSEKVSVLESKVQQLEMENKWLKNLLVEKNEGNEEIVTLWKEFAASKAGSKSSESKAQSPVKEETR